MIKICKSIIIVILMLCLASCGTSTTISRNQINSYFSIVQDKLADTEHMYGYYIINETLPDFNRIIQSVNGKREYIEKTSLFTKYYMDGEAIIIENGMRRKDAEFSFDPFDIEAENVYENLRTLILSYTSDMFDGQKWEGIFPDRSLIFREIDNDDINILNLNAMYISADISILFDNDLIMYFTLTAHSNQNSGTIVYIFGNIDYSLVLDFPES